jgi:O-antigen/teichoic acid export membrane protein
MSDAASARGFAWNLVFAGASNGSAVLLLVLFVFAGRVLGPEEFGKFYWALALGTILETLMDFGFHQVLIREVARDRARATDLLRHVFGIKLVWTTAGMLTLVVAATALRSEPDVRMACYLIGASLVARSYMFTVRGVLQGLERFGWDSFVVIADRALLLALGLAALASGAGVLGLAAAFVAARVLALGLVLWTTRRQIGQVGIRYDPHTWRELQRSALPFGFFLIVLNLYSYIDGVMLGVMRGDVENGLYGAAYKVYEGFTYAPSVIAAVLTPRLAALFVSNPAAHRRLAFGGLVASAAMAVVVGGIGYLAAEPLMMWLFSTDASDYAAAAAPFRILCAGLAAVFVIWVLHAIAISVNREKLLLKAAAAGLVVNVAMNLWLIPTYGASGAAIATVVGEIVSLMVLIAGLV